MSLLSCIALTTLGAAPVSVASVAKTGKAGVVFSSLKLAGSNGYSIEIVGIIIGGQRRVSLKATNGDVSAEYAVPTTKPRGLHAELPSRGVVSLTFRSTRRSVRRFSPNCRFVTERGVFHGTVQFAGELGYTSVNASGGPGEVERFPNGLCDPIGNRIARPAIPIPFRSTFLNVRSGAGGRVIEFTASRLNGRISTVNFNASLRERLGKMTINRRASARGGRGSFETSAPGEQPKSAVVGPPQPFQGKATFEQFGAAAPTWAGSLSVPLPGATLTSLAGEGFAARLCLRASPFRGCGRRARAQGSGSQSQAFWDTRLSWSR